MPTIKSTFEGHKKPEALIVEVGPRPEYVQLPAICVARQFIQMKRGLIKAPFFSRWKKADHIHRKQWNVHNVPTVVRFETVDGRVTETGRLVEDEILYNAKLTALLEGL